MNMLKRLPYYYGKSKIVKDLYTAIQAAIDKTEIDIDTEALNFFITKTSDFTSHENDVGIASDTSLHATTRRAQVVANLQGYKLLTVAELKSLVSLYDKTGCSIKEDYKNYTVTIIFDGRKGTPHNFAQLKSAIDDVKPAHLNIKYEFMRNTWGECHNKLGVWGNGKRYTWGGAAYYDGRTWLYVYENGDVYQNVNNTYANAYVIFKDGEPYAHLL